MSRRHTRKLKQGRKDQKLLNWIARHATGPTEYAGANTMVVPLGKTTLVIKKPRGNGLLTGSTGDRH